MSNHNRPLWAPWRIEFIRSSKENGCFLCDKEHNRSTPEEEIILYRGKSSFIIMNRYPYNSGHLMIVPYRHIADISDLNDTEKIEMFDLLAIGQQGLKKVMNPDAFNVGFNLGAAAGAGLEEHLHQHIVPRWNGDTNFMPVISDCRVVPEALLDTATLLKSAIQSCC